MTLPDNVYALDIETSNLDVRFDPEIPAGLDPRAGRITAISVVSSKGLVWHRQDSSEFSMLQDFMEFVDSYNVTWVTWNGGAFDWPYLYFRCRSVHLLWPSFELHLRTDREPKYSPLPTFEGVYAVEMNGDLCDHIDLAHVITDEMAKEWDVKRSLKPIGRFIEANDKMIDQMQGDTVSGERPARLAAYNINDCELTLAVWDFCKMAVTIGPDKLTEARDGLSY